MSPNTRRKESRPFPVVQLHLPGSDQAPITGDDLMGDLDPGWLDWREEAAAR